MEKVLEPVIRRKKVEKEELGVAAHLITQSSILNAVKLVKQGRIYDLGVERYHGMPVPAMHPPLEILTYRSIIGMQNEGDQEWITGKTNPSKFGFTSDLVISCLHTGAHIDTFAHPNIGEDHHWHGGYSALTDVGDFGALKSDASTLPPFFCRGVLLDVAGYLGVSALPKNTPITVKHLEETIRRQKTEIRDGDVVLVRAGYMSVWPDKEKLREHAGSGLTLDSAKWLCQKELLAVGSDTEALEQFPGTDPTNPHPVHTYLLIEKGIYMIEWLDLEGLAKDKIYEFLFIALPVKFRGGTGGLVDPVAVI